MITTLAQNVLSAPSRTVYLHEPLNKEPDKEDETEPQDTPESVELTSANLSQEEETYKKRFDDATKYIRELKTSNETQINELKTQLNELSTKLITDKAAPSVMPKTPEEFKEFKEKYPELVAMITTAAMMVSADSSTAVEVKLKALEDQQKAISAKEGITELKKYHPDFEQIKDDPRFVEWFNMQPVEIKNLIRSPNPKVIATGLDKFKEYAGIKTPAAKKEDKKAATRDINTPTNRVQIGEGRKRTYTNAEINKMPMAEFEKNKDDIIAAQYEGRIVG
jgi:hypothetical protein